MICSCLLVHGNQLPICDKLVKLVIISKTCLLGTLHSYLPGKIFPPSREFCTSAGPSEFVRSLVENINLDEFILPRQDDAEKFYSNDLADSVQSKCQICGVDVRINQMRQHTRKFHDVAIKDYITKFGNPRHHIVKHVYHKCGECSEELLFDADPVDLHVAKHSMSLHDYTEKYLKKVRGLGIPRKDASAHGEKLTSKGVHVSLKLLYDVENLCSSTQYAFHFEIEFGHITRYRT